MLNILITLLQILGIIILSGVIIFTSLIVIYALAYSIKIIIKKLRGTKRVGE